MPTTVNGGMKPERLIYNNNKLPGKARKVTDDNLSAKISQLKYPGEERAKEPRVTIEVTLEDVEDIKN